MFGISTPADDCELEALLGKDAASAILNKQHAPQDVDVLPENWPAVQLFMNAQSAWQRCPMSGYLLGMNYSDVDVLIRRSGLDITTGDWGRFQALERIAVAEINKKS